MKSRITVFTKWMLDFMFYAGILVTLTLPLTVYMIYHNKVYGWYYVGLLILFAVSGVLALLIIWELRRMFRTVLADDCFVESNVNGLRRMGSYSFWIAAVWCVRVFLYVTPASGVVILVFVVAGLFSKVLSQVFDRAVTYKRENDLTI